MAVQRKRSPGATVVTALSARTHFGRILTEVERERRSFVVERRGRPKAVILSVADYVRLAAPEPEVLRIVGEESRVHGTDRLESREIDRVIREARREKRARHASAQTGS